jgi:hypothetical protein
MAGVCLKPETNHLVLRLHTHEQSVRHVAQPMGQPDYRPLVHALATT